MLAQLDPGHPRCSSSVSVLRRSRNTVPVNNHREAQVNRQEQMVDMPFQGPEPDSRDYNGARDWSQTQGPDDSNLLGASPLPFILPVEPVADCGMRK